MMLFKEFNIEYAKYFQEKSPARVTVAVELPLNALVEISAIAHKD
jgi:enamine deaminase RidA (YjgF/YER057c/UK114 family)